MNNYYARKINRIMKPQWVPPSFAPVAKTVIYTIIGSQLNTAGDTLINGFKFIGTLVLSRMEAITGDFPVITAAGGISVATKINANGADDFMQIYKQYRVWASGLIFRWRNNTPQVTTEAVHNITNNDTATATVAAHDHVHFAQQTIALVCIPSTSATDPVSSWSECINHPFAIMSKQQLNGVNNRFQTFKIPEIHHASFIRLINSMTTTQVGEELHRREFTDDTEVIGQDIFYHMYMIDRTGFSDVADIEIESTVYIQQKVLMYKTIQADGDLMTIIGNEGQQDEGELVSL